MDLEAEETLEGLLSNQSEVIEEDVGSSSGSSSSALVDDPTIPTPPPLDATNPPPTTNTNTGNNNTNTNNNNNNREPAWSTPNGRRRVILLYWRAYNALLLIYLIPMTIGIGITLISSTKEHTEGCNNLKYWLCIQLVFQIIKMASIALLYYRLPRLSSTDQQIESAFENLYWHYVTNRALDMFWFIWFVIGVYTSFSVSSGTCPIDATNTYNLGLAVSVIQMVMFTLGLMIACSLSCTGILNMTIGHALIHAPPSAPRGATRDMINQLPSKKFSADLGIDADHSSCAICLSDYEPGELLRFLPCNHHFHVPCADKWLETNKSCPFCKRCIDQKDGAKKVEEEEDVFDASFIV